ncbi:hypothetical protein ACHQM5_003375 [Ranunculus cassubicifolius]
MGAEGTNPNKVSTINPNWAQLQQKLKNEGSKYKRKENPKSILGKRKDRIDDEEETVDTPVESILTPKNSDCSLTDAIAMDCEMVGISPQGNKSALGRVTLVNTYGNTVYDEFVRPLERVVDFRTAISGIHPRDMRKAKDIRVVQTKVAELLKGKILVGHALNNDLKALLLSHPRYDIRDTSDYPPFLQDGRRRKLKSLAAEFLGVQIQDGEHCPVEDARAAMMLYQKNKKQWEKSIEVRLMLKEKHKNRRPKKKKKKIDDAAI